MQLSPTSLRSTTKRYLHQTYCRTGTIFSDRAHHVRTLSEGVEARARPRRGPAAARKAAALTKILVTVHSVADAHDTDAGDIDRLGDAGSGSPLQPGHLARL